MMMMMNCFVSSSSLNAFCIGFYLLSFGERYVSFTQISKAYYFYIPLSRVIWRDIFILLFMKYKTEADLSSKIKNRLFSYFTFWLKVISYLKKNNNIVMKLYIRLNA